MIGVRSGAPACVMPARGAMAAGNGAANDSAMASASPASKPTRAETGSSRAGAEPTARPAGDAAATGQSAGGQSVTGSIVGDAAAKHDAAHDGPGRDGAANGGFAALLAASGPSAATATPLPASDATDANACDSVDPVAAELPGQFLALMSGSWAVPTTAATAPAEAGTTGTSGLPTAAASAGGLPLAAASAGVATLTTGDGPESRAEPAADSRNAARKRVHGEPPPLTGTLPPAMATQHPPGMPPAAAATPQAGSRAPNAAGDIVVSPGEPAPLTRGASAERATIEPATGQAGQAGQAPMLASNPAKTAGLPLATAPLSTAPATAPAGAASERPASDAGASPSDATAALGSVAPTGAAPTAEGARITALPPTAPLALPADPDAGFDDGFGARIAWMAEQRLGHAQIRLNPEHVGPIDVRVQLDGNRVSAEFTSAHAEVRQAIEASLPRLREMLGQHGLQLGQADVGQRQAGQGQATRRDGSGNGDGRDAGDDAPGSLTTSRLPIRGLLDEYA